MKITLEFDDRKEVIECSQVVLVGLDESDNIVTAFMCNPAWLTYVTSLLNAYNTRIFEPMLDSIEESDITISRRESPPF